MSKFSPYSVVTLAFVLCLPTQDLYAVEALGGPSIGYPEAQRRELISVESSWEFAAKKVYAENPKTFYCGCPFVTSEGYQGSVNPVPCGLSAQAETGANTILTWDSVVPPAWYARNMQCWTVGHDACHHSGVPYAGQACCALLDRDYMLAQADLHNIVPIPLSINQSKASHPVGIVSAEPRDFGTCNFEVGGYPKRSEPSADKRGDVARIWLYMADTYSMKLSLSYRRLLNKWHKADPIDQVEKERNSIIRGLQGQNNSYVEPYHE